MTKARILPIEHIEAKPGSGKPRVRGAGVTVELLHWFIHDPEWPVERICQEYGLTPGQVYAAWSYYEDHKAEIDQQIAEQRARSAEYERLYPQDNQKRDMLIASLREKQKAKEA